MEILQKTNNQKLLQELKERVINQKLSEEQIFQVLHSPLQEEIKDYEMVDISHLTKEDWKKAYQSLDHDKFYQEEVNLWEAIDNE